VIATLIGLAVVVVLVAIAFIVDVWREDDGEPSAEASKRKHARGGGLWDVWVQCWCDSCEGSHWVNGTFATREDAEADAGYFHANFPLMGITWVRRHDEGPPDWSKQGEARWI
jgi:hypothetical protein